MELELTECCEKCGRPLPSARENALEDTLSRTQRGIYHALRRAGTAGQSQRELVAALYGTRENGGPLNTGLVITLTIRKMRARLKPYGLVITARPPTGCNARRYLERLP